ncbi:MAG: flagellar basal body rod protein FlgB [FCB group bacterium]
MLGKVNGLIYRDFLFKARLPLLNSGLDAYALRQKTIAKNIANATTPHYKPESVKFEEFFSEAQTMVAKGTTTDEMHIPIGNDPSTLPEAEVESPPVPKAEIYFSGESHVNIDTEMSQLAQNQIRYRFAARAVKAYFQGLQSAISGTRV